MRRFSYILILLLIAPFSVLTESSYDQLPSTVSSSWNSSQHIGKTKFTRFSIHIYDASLWSLSNNTSQAKALSIKYAREISAKRLLSSTKKQWNHLGFADLYPIEAWLEELMAIWPDVKAGDQLIFIYADNGNSEFIFNNTKLGSINDQRFGKAFLDIWLSSRAKYQKHRKELLSESI